MARPRTAQGTPAFTDLLICSACKAAYLGQDAKLAACDTCGAALTSTHARGHALAMPDMLAKRRTTITSDEEERTRLGYRISEHYQMGTKARHYRLSPQGGTQPLLDLTYEHNGRIILVNEGLVQAQREDGEDGFVLCQKCNRWLFSAERMKEHVDPQSPHACRHGATKDDLAHQVTLYSDAHMDVITLDVPPPADLPREEWESFYMSLATALAQATAISLDLDESELNGFLAPHPEDADRQRIILYETAEGGAGAVEALTDVNRLRLIASRACEILHAPQETPAVSQDQGCERACYDCLCSFYNQRNHHLLNRHLALPLLGQLSQPLQSVLLSSASSAALSAEATLEALLPRCQSELERTVLRAIYAGGLPLPDDAQHLCTASLGAPVASADFYYAEQRLAVLVDGPPHAQDYVQAADQNRRIKLKSAGYSVLVIAHDAIGDGLKQLAQWLNVPLRAKGEEPLPRQGQNIVRPTTAWAPWVYDECARALHPVLRALESAGSPPPDEVGCDLLVEQRVVATVELRWSNQQLAAALPQQVSLEAQQKLSNAGWQIITIDPAQPEPAITALRQTLLAGAPIN